MLAPEARAACAKYVVDQARHVIDTFGQRAPGSPGEREAQAYVAQCLENLGADEVRSETFPVAAEAFMRCHYLSGWLMLLAFAAYWLLPPLALALGIGAFLITWYQFAHYRLLLDPLYPSTESVNVYARWAPANEVKRRFVLNAHTDAAFEWRFHYLWPRAFPWLMRYGLGAFAVALAAQLFGIIIWIGAPGSNTFVYLGLVQALALPGFVMALLHTDFSRPVPGANDNLSGVFLALGVVKALRESGVSFEHTELACLITGSEEAGLRGAKAWAARHARGFRDVETVFLALDTFHDLEHLTIYQGDLNGTVKNDPAFSALIQQAAKTCGHEARIGSIPLGSTDAAAFTQAGLTATALVAMDPAPAPFYHTRRDNAGDMRPGCLASVAGVIAEAIRRFDTGKKGSAAD
jgi:hypothetical protein